MLAGRPGPTSPRRKKHIQAVLALARRRVNVLWALIRDGRCYDVIPPVTTAALKQHYEAGSCILGWPQRKDPRFRPDPPDLRELCASCAPLPVDGRDDRRRSPAEATAP